MNGVTTSREQTESYSKQETGNIKRAYVHTNEVIEQTRKMAITITHSYVKIANNREAIRGNMTPTDTNSDTQPKFRRPHQGEVIMSHQTK